MQKYILITHDKIKFILSEMEYKAIIQVIAAGKKQVMVQGELIPLNIIPSVVKFERWYAQENQRLALTNYRLCKKCLSAMRIDNVCACWDEKGLGEDKNAFIEIDLPQSVKQIISGIAKSKQFPALSSEDIADIEAEKQKRIVTNTGEDETGSYFLEDGEKIYS